MPPMGGTEAFSGALIIGVGSNQWQGERQIMGQVLGFLFDVVAWALAGFVIVGSALAALPIATGPIRMLDFPRAAMVPLGGIAILCTALALTPPLSLWVMAATALATLSQLVAIWPWLPLAPVQSLPPDDSCDQALDVRVLLANVKMSNRSYDRLVALVEETDPDILVALETDDKWVDGLAPIRDRFEGKLEAPKDTGYGMAIYCRWPIEDIDCHDSITPGAPAWSVTVCPPGKPRFRLRAVHPEPPILGRDTERRDAETYATARDTMQEDLPTIVVGDFNDVPWSPAMRRMQRLTGLCDPRRGRGLYSSFHARRLLTRWPVDHLFHSPEFRLAEIRRAGRIGSDHLPMLWDLVLCPSDPASGEAEDTPTGADREIARETLKREAGRERRPSGEDWEKAEEEAASD